jgi:hypothetical protein
MSMPSRFESWRAVRRTVCLWAAVGGLLAVPTQHIAAQIAVDELETHMKIGRDSLARAIAVRNESDSTQQVRITMKDWFRDSTGMNVFVDYGTHQASCTDRLTVFPLTLQLPPRATEFVRLSYRSRGETDEGCWSIVLIEPVRPPITVAGAQATAELTILNGVKVYVHRAEERQSGEVIYADVETYFEAVQPGNPRSDSLRVRDIAVRYENTGTSHLIVNSIVEIRDETTQIVRRIEGPTGYITPAAFRDFVVRVPADLPRGRYAAIILLDSGDDEVQAAQVDFEIP